VDSPARAQAILAETGARGLMIGRGAIRNPWIFDQIRALGRNPPLALPTGRAVLRYVTELYEAVCTPGVRESAQVQKMKKYLNFIGLGLETTAPFLHDIRRVTTREDFFRVCREHLDHDEEMDLVPKPSEMHLTPALSPSGCL
jgi:tRNA-dihydrouridine synthase